MNSSEEYIIRLMQSIGLFDSLVRDLRVEVSFLRDEFARLREKNATHDMERKRLMRLLEAKDEDIRKMTERMSDLLGKVYAFTAGFEDKSHQLTNRNRAQFSTKSSLTLNQLEELMIM